MPTTIVASTGKDCTSVPCTISVMMCFTPMSFPVCNTGLRRWLDGEPCVFVSPVTGALIEIEIGEDFDAMFHFLEFCRKQNNHEPIDDDFCDYLALLITKSQRRCCEEC